MIKEEVQAYWRGSCYTSLHDQIKKDGELFARVDCQFLRYNRSELLSRLLRRKIHQLIPFEHGLVAVIKRRILIFDDTGKKTGDIVIDRGSRPLQQGAVIIDGQLFYGDYWPNPERAPVHVYRVDLSTMHKTILRSFPGVRHIHAVQQDWYVSGKLLVCTGDADQESGIYQLDTVSGQCETIQEGGQYCRAVSLLQVGEQLLWGSDSPDQKNAIYMLKRSASSRVIKLCDIDGPAYYSSKLPSGELFISTGIEHSAHRAIIYRSIDSGSTWNLYKEFKKDCWPQKYFGYGLVDFPLNQEFFSYKLYALK